MVKISNKDFNKIYNSVWFHYESLISLRDEYPEDKEYYDKKLEILRELLWRLCNKRKKYGIER